MIQSSCRDLASVRSPPLLAQIFHDRPIKLFGVFNEHKMPAALCFFEYFELRTLNLTMEREYEAASTERLDLSLFASISVHSWFFRFWASRVRLCLDGNRIALLSAPDQHELEAR
jgi:hypothetical protein